MNADDLFLYRIEQLEARMDRIEKFIFAGLITCALSAGSLMLLIIDLPSRIVKADASYQTKNN
jgi:hypothetical protein